MSWSPFSKSKGSSPGKFMPFFHKILQGAAATVSISPIPGVQAAIQLVDQIITGIENVKMNREMMKALIHDCRQLQEVLGNIDKSQENDTLQKMINELEELLRNILSGVQVWIGCGDIKSYLLQSQILGDISQWSVDIEKHTRYFQLATLTSIGSSTRRIEVSIAQVQQMHEGELGELQKLQLDMKNMHEQLCRMEQGSKLHQSLAKGLYNIQKRNNMMLPEVELKAGEVRRDGTSPSGGSAEFDIWRGWYLETEMVSLKVLRNRQFDPKQKERLIREVGIWRKLWEIDQGKYIARFYGICFIDGPYPYLVLPNFENGDLMTYLRLHPNVDRLALIRHIAEGLQFLHSQEPPIVHGELRAERIVISDNGLPLFGDFGLSRMLDNATSTQFTRTNFTTALYRWFAPELCSDSYTMSAASDVFSFSMTVLEIFTGELPWSYIKRAQDVLLEMKRGKRPPRPTSSTVVERGLNDKMWNLLERCWAQDPTNRPTMEQVLEEL